MRTHLPKSSVSSDNPQFVLCIFVQTTRGGKSFTKSDLQKEEESSLPRSVCAAITPPDCRHLISPHSKGSVETPRPVQHTAASDDGSPLANYTNSRQSAAERTAGVRLLPLRSCGSSTARARASQHFIEEFVRASRGRCRRGTPPFPSPTRQV